MKALALYLDGLPTEQRETALHIVREHHLSDNDPLIALLALMRLSDSAFALALDEVAQAHKAALDSHAGQLSREIAELRKDLAQTREAPRLVAESVEKLHVETAGIEAAAAELASHSRERMQEFIFYRMSAAFVSGIAIFIFLTKFAAPWIGSFFHR